MLFDCSSENKFSLMAIAKRNCFRLNEHFGLALPIITFGS